MTQPLGVTDPNIGPHSGQDRILHAPFAAGTIFDRRGGKAVDLHHRYQAATAASSNLAGFAEVEEVGTSDGRPASVADGDELAVNFGLQKAFVFPTTGRKAVAADVGKGFDIAVVGNAQHIDLTSSANQVLTVVKVVDNDGDFVSAAIPVGKRFGNL